MNQAQAVLKGSNVSMIPLIEVCVYTLTCPLKPMYVGETTRPFKMFRNMLVTLK